MGTYLVTIGPSKERVENPDLEDRIGGCLRQTYGSAFSRLAGSWIVQSDRTADAIRDALLSEISELRCVLVVKVGQDAAWAGFNSLDSDWLLSSI